jgi:hypothetical protein
MVGSSFANMENGAKDRDGQGQGEQGEQGERGEQGEQGERGERGERGEPEATLGVSLRARLRRAKQPCSPTVISRAEFRKTPLRGRKVASHPFGMLALTRR